MITIEMIDKVMERTGCSYERAKELLKKTEGNVEEAIFEFNLNNDNLNNKANNVDNVVSFLKDIIKKGNITKITVKKDDKIVLNVPLNLGIVATVFAFTPTVFAIATAFVTGCTVTIQKNDGTSFDLKEVVLEKGKDLSENVKQKVEDYKEKRENTEENQTEEATEEIENIEETENNTEEKEETE